MNHWLSQRRSDEERSTDGHTLTYTHSLSGNHRHAGDSFWPVNLAFPNIGILYSTVSLSVHKVVFKIQRRRNIWHIQYSTHRFVLFNKPVKFQQVHKLFFIINICFVSCRGSSSESTLTSQATLLGPILKLVSSSLGQAEGAGGQRLVSTKLKDRVHTEFRAEGSGQATRLTNRLMLNNKNAIPILNIP